MLSLPTMVQLEVCPSLCICHYLLSGPIQCLWHLAHSSSSFYYALYYRVLMRAYLLLVERWFLWRISHFFCLNSSLFSLISLLSSFPLPFNSAYFLQDIAIGLCNAFFIQSDTCVTVKLCPDFSLCYVFSHLFPSFFRMWYFFIMIYNHNTDYTVALIWGILDSK